MLPMLAIILINKLIMGHIKGGVAMNRFSFIRLTMFLMQGHNYLRGIISLSNYASKVFMPRAD